MFQENQLGDDFRERYIRLFLRLPLIITVVQTTQTSFFKFVCNSKLVSKVSFKQSDSFFIGSKMPFMMGYSYSYSGVNISVLSCSHGWLLNFHRWRKCLC